MERIVCGNVDCLADCRHWSFRGIGEGEGERDEWDRVRRCDVLNGEARDIAGDLSAEDLVFDGVQSYR